MSKVASNIKSVYELFIEETEKDEPCVDILESLIDRLPKEDIDKITELNLCFKNLNKLPDNIGRLTNLLTLLCYNNKISKIPRMMKNYYSSSSESGERGFVSSFAS